MDRSVIAAVIALLSITANGQLYYVFTNAQGRLQATPSQADTVYAVGAVATSSVAPIVQSDDVSVAVYDVVQAEMLVIEIDGKGIGYVPAEDGTLLPIMYAHESPYPSKSELDRRAAQAKEKHRTRKTDLSAIKTNAAAANSVPALREQVRRLAELLEARP